MTAGTVPRGGITFHHPLAFWLGTGGITAGVLLHAPDYIASAHMGYRMAGMDMSWMMSVGMALIVAGIALAALLLALSPGFGLISTVVALPVVASGVMLALAGIETRNRGIEEAVPIAAVVDASTAVEGSTSPG